MKRSTFLLPSNRRASRAVEFKDAYGRKEKNIYIATAYTIECLSEQKTVRWSCDVSDIRCYYMLVTDNGYVIFTGSGGAGIVTPNGELRTMDSSLISSIYYMCGMNKKGSKLIISDSGDTLLKTFSVEKEGLNSGITELDTLSLLDPSDSETIYCYDPAILRNGSIIFKGYKYITSESTNYTILFRYSCGGDLEWSYRNEDAWDLSMVVDENNNAVYLMEQTSTTSGYSLTTSKINLLTGSVVWTDTQTLSSNQWPSVDLSQILSDGSLLIAGSATTTFLLRYTSGGTLTYLQEYSFYGYCIAIDEENSVGYLGNNSDQEVDSFNLDTGVLVSDWAISLSLYILDIALNPYNSGELWIKPSTGTTIYIYDVSGSSPVSSTTFTMPEAQHYWIWSMAYRCLQFKEVNIQEEQKE